MGRPPGVELYLAAVIVFGVRLFNNLGIIRRYLLKNTKENQPRLKE